MDPKEGRHGVTHQGGEATTTRQNINPSPEFPPVPESLDRDTAIKRIKHALKVRSGIEWSVTGGRGTAWGWIEIRAVKKHAANQYGRLTEEHARLLADLLGLDRPEYNSVSIPASNDHYREYVDRAEGRKPSVTGKQYWD